jgi:Regulator of chromosome condensation (RCC1) repeat
LSSAIQIAAERKEGEMNFSMRSRLPLRLCALVALSLGLLVSTGSAGATAPGAVIAWGCGGSNDYGQCNVPSDLSDATAIAAGEFHSLALREDGSVVAWGCLDVADFGECSVPSGLSGVTAIAAGSYHSLALLGDGTVVAWGCALQNVGQCSVPSGLSGVTAIAAGAFQSLALKGDGTVVAWGCGPYDFGQCNVPNGLSDGTAIAAGTFGSLAMKGDGTVVEWGCGSSVPEWCSVPSGLSDVIGIAAGGYHDLAVKADGTVIAWGCNTYPVGQCDVPENLSGVTAVAAGVSHSVALKADGTVVAWGCGAENVGQCDVPAGLSGVRAISAGRYQTLAIVGPNQPPDCSAVAATPSTLGQMRDRMPLIALSGATDPDGDTLSYHIDGVTQDEYVTGVGDDTSPDAALTAAGADSNQVKLRSEANPQFNGRVYRIAYTVSDDRGGSCSGIAGRTGSTTAKVSVPRRKGTSAIDDGNATSWDSFTGTPVQ